MNVFVLNTGRCGSTTFYKACRHMTNFTTGHESRSRFIGDERLNYPPNHIEADNRLSWVLGRLHKAYGDDAFYVHLRRDDAATAKSFVSLYHGGIIRAYREGVLKGASESSHPLDVSLDYCDTVNTNIELFLQDKTATMSFTLENGREDFRRFWNLVGAEGDLEAALAEWDVAHNSTRERKEKPAEKKTALMEAGKRVRRAIKTSPVIATPRRWAAQMSLGGARTGWVMLGWALILAVLLVDLSTSAYNLAILYPVLAVLLAFVSHKRSWAIAGLMVVLTYVGYLRGPWPESAQDNWGEMFLSYRMLNRTLVAVVLIALTPILSALVDRYWPLNTMSRRRPRWSWFAAPARVRTSAMVSCPLLVLAVTAVDVWTPPRVNASIFLAIPLLLCVWTSSRRYLWAMAAVATIASACAFLWDAIPVDTAGLPFSPNRAIAILIVPTLAALMH